MMSASVRSPTKNDKVAVTANNNKSALRNCRASTSRTRTRRTAIRFGPTRACRRATSSAVSPSLTVSRRCRTTSGGNVAASITLRSAETSSPTTVELTARLCPVRSKHHRLTPRPRSLCDSGGCLKQEADRHRTSTTIVHFAMWSEVPDARRVGSTDEVAVLVGNAGEDALDGRA